MAWHGMTLCQTDLDKKVECLNRVLDIDPSNLKATRLLKYIQQKNPNRINDFALEPELRKNNISKPAKVVILQIIDISNNWRGL